MISGLYISASGGLAENARQQVTTNNMANVNSPGFKIDTMTFRVRPPEIQEDGLFPDGVDPIAELVGGGMFLARSYTDFSDGALEVTGNPLNLALQGPGFFEVEMPNGEKAYTRAGNFMIDPQGFLSDHEGNRVMSKDGNPIPMAAIPDPVFTVDGQIQSGTTKETFGNLAVKTFADLTQMQKMGSSLYTSNQVALDATVKEVKVHQGALEGSNATPVTEMVNMINGFRAYEANMQMIKIQDTNLQAVVNDVGRV